MVFTVAERTQIRDEILALARQDQRIVAGAVIGSTAGGDGDRWSDLDLTFGVAAGTTNEAILDDWAAALGATRQAVPLFDLPSGAALYRVFLFPGCLQVDLSVAPIAQFGATGPHFHLLFGEAVEKPWPQAPTAVVHCGYAVHHVLRARIAVERERLWQALYWLNTARDEVFSLTCLRLQLPTAHGRGVDALPPALRERLCASLVPTLARAPILAALQVVIDALLAEGQQAGMLDPAVAQQLQSLCSPW